MNQKLRIIAGNFRGRKVSFVANKGLRPTPDRLRETLFNWLSPIIYQTKCLDLFAGSGILGFEASSRGAASVVFVDQSYQVIQQLKQNSDKLYRAAIAEKSPSLIPIQFFCCQSADFLKRNDLGNFDIIFVDPPFHSNLMNQTITLLENNNWLKAKAYIYLEMEKSHPPLILPKHWQIVKQKTMGQIHCFLILRQTIH